MNVYQDYTSSQSGGGIRQAVQTNKEATLSQYTLGKKKVSEYVGNILRYAVMHRICTASLNIQKHIRWEVNPPILAVVEMF